MIDFLSERLQLNLPVRPARFMQSWRDLAERVDNVYKKVNIALVGKYTKLEDSYASLSKALLHASLAVGYKLDLKFIEACHLERQTKQETPHLYYEAWQSLTNSHGVIVPGGFGSRGIEGKIRACQWSRENKKPFLGICLGLQAAVIEFARNVLKLEDANSTEVDSSTKHPMVIDMPEHHPGQMGGTMRLGKRTTIFKDEKSKIRQLYNNASQIEERHRHRYEVNPDYVAQLEARGLKFVGHDSEKTRMEIIELEGHPYYVATQYHPEYLSRPLKPSPPFLGLILASVGKLDAYLQQGNKLSSSAHVTSESSSDDDTALFSTNNLLKKMQLNGKPSKQKQGSPLATIGDGGESTAPKCNGTHVADCKHESN